MVKLKKSIVAILSSAVHPYWCIFGKNEVETHCIICSRKLNCRYDRQAFADVFKYLLEILTCFGRTYEALAHFDAVAVVH